MAVGILCGQLVRYWRIELGSSIWSVRVIGIGGREGLLRKLQASCIILEEVADSSQESLAGECLTVRERFGGGVTCGWVVITEVWVWSNGVLCRCVVNIERKCGVNGLWLDHEESILSSPEFKFAAYWMGWTRCWLISIQRKNCSRLISARRRWVYNSLTWIQLKEKLSLSQLNVYQIVS